MPILGRAGIGPVTSNGVVVTAPFAQFRPSMIVVQPNPGSPASSARVEFSSPVPVTRQVTVSLPSSGSIVSAWNTAMAAAQSGDELLIPAGSYTCDGNLDITKSGITITIAEATITHTNTTQHGLRVKSGASNILIKGAPAASSFIEPGTVFQTTGVSGRGDQNVQGHATLLIDAGSSNVYVQDILFSGAKGTGCFNYNGVGVFYNRVWSRNSLADGFHNTNAARNVRAWDCTSQNCGDDGFAVVHYSPRDPASSQSSNVIVRRHRVLGTTHGRGLAAVNCPDVHFEDCFVRDSDAAGLWIVNEKTEASANAPAGISDVTASNIYLYGCNTDAGVDHGPWGVLNSDSTLTPTGIVLTDIVSEASPTGAWSRVVNANATVTRWKHYGPTDIQCFISNATVTDQGTWSKPSGTTATPGQPQFAASTAAGGGGTTPGGGRPPVSVAPVVVLDGDTLGATGSAVSSWADTVAARAFAQGTAGLQPTVVDAPNGHRAVRFDAKALVSDASTAACAAITIVMVMRLDAVPTVARSGFISAATSSTANDYATDGGWTLSGPFSTSETAFDSMLVGGSPTGVDSRIKTSSQPLGQWVVITAVIGSDGVPVKEYTNGTVDPINTGGADNADLTLNRLVLGARYYGTLADYNRYSLAHARIYPARLTAEDRATVHSEMQDRYGITVADYVPAGQVGGTGALTGSGTLSAAASPATGGGAGLSGSGSLISAGTPMATAAAALSGSGGLAAAGAPAVAGPAALTGSGSLATTGTPSSSAPAALSGTGNLTATPTPSTSGAGSLSGTGTLAASGALAQSAPAALSGIGTLTGTGAAKTSGQGALGGSGQLSGSGSGAENGTSTASLSGAGQLAASGSPTSRGAGALAGAGTLAATGRPAVGQPAALTGSGQLAATGSGTERATGTAALSGAGQLAATATPATSAAGSLTGSGQLAAAGQVGDRPPYTPHLYVDAAVLPAVHAAALTVDGVSSSTLTEAAGLATLQT